jgi:predicted dienelactone hydrolase
MKRIIHVEYIVILLIGLFGCNSDPEQISYSEFLTTHSYSVGQTSLELYDEERGRPIKTEIWYPTSDTSNVNITLDYPFILPPTSEDADIASGKFPLIMLSHGTGGNRISQMWLACELTGNGYIVASVDHFGNTLDNKIPENFIKVWDRPLDISFVVSNLLTNTYWKSAIDSSQIGMVGFSLGGYTAIALAGGIIDYKQLNEFSKTKEGKNEFNLPELGDVSKYITPEIIESGNKEHKNLKDSRISAFIAMAPALGQGFRDKNQFENVDKPILIIGAQNDERAPVNTNAKYYNNLIENSRYLELKGQVGHYIFMNVAKNGLKRNAPMIFEDDKSIDRNDIHIEVSRTVIEFFNENWNIKSH